MVGFAKRLYLSKKYKDNSLLHELFAYKIDELCKYNILLDVENKLCISRNAEYFIDNIYFFMLDDATKAELERSGLIYRFEK